MVLAAITADLQANSVLFGVPFAYKRFSSFSYIVELHHITSVIYC